MAPTQSQAPKTALKHSRSKASSPVRGRTAGMKRIHLTLKKEAIRPDRANLPQQQAKFDAFVVRKEVLVSRAGLEPATTALKVRCSTN